ncbi:MAG: hypothetical protein ACK5GN_09850 [Pseudomonadota bacterium]
MTVREFKDLRQLLGKADLTPAQIAKLMEDLNSKLAEGIKPAKGKKMEGTLSQEVSSARKTRAVGNLMPAIPGYTEERWVVVGRSKK